MVIGELFWEIWNASVVTGHAGLGPWDDGVRIVDFVACWKLASNRNDGEAS